LIDNILKCNRDLRGGTILTNDRIFNEDKSVPADHGNREKEEEEEEELEI